MHWRHYLQSLHVMGMYLKICTMHWRWSILQFGQVFEFLQKYYTCLGITCDLVSNLIFLWKLARVCSSSKGFGCCWVSGETGYIGDFEGRFGCPYDWHTYCYGGQWCSLHYIFMGAFHKRLRRLNSRNPHLSSTQSNARYEWEKTLWRKIPGCISQLIALDRRQTYQRRYFEHGDSEWGNTQPTKNCGRSFNRRHLFTCTCNLFHVSVD